MVVIPAQRLLILLSLLRDEVLHFVLLLLAIALHFRLSLDGLFLEFDSCEINFGFAERVGRSDMGSFSG